MTLGANWGLAGAVLNVQSQGEATQVYPVGYSRSGNDVLADHAEYVNADLTITLYDAWPFEPQITGRLRWAPWLPVDSKPLPRAVRRAIQNAYQPIAYSRFGFNEMREAGLDPRYVPHGIDSKLFKPKNRDKAKAALPEIAGADVDFLAVMVAANKGSPSRKAFSQILCAWRTFIDLHPKSILYLHTYPLEHMAGENLLEQLELLDMPSGAVALPDIYGLKLGFPPEYMVNIYNAADVLLSPSLGEGFGLPILEAQACGCPVIVNDATAMPELLFAGWKTTNQPIYVPTGAYQFIPDIDSILESLELAYEERGNEGLRKRARKGALPYDADRITREYWRPVLAELEEEIVLPAQEADPLQMVTE